MRTGHRCFLPLLCPICPVGLGCRKCPMLMCCLPVSWAVHGLRGGAAVNASAGLQHQNSGHQVRLNATELLLARRFSLVMSRLWMWGRASKSVVRLSQTSAPYTHTHHSLLIYFFVCFLTLSPRFRSLLLACFFLSCSPLTVYLCVCVCVYTPAALPAPKLECSGILVVSFWFP